MEKKLMIEELNRIKSLMGIIIESSYEEAWELVGQENSVISNIVSKSGYNNDEESVQKLIPIIEKLPVKEFTYENIKEFKNLENKKNDKGLINLMKKISDTKNPRKEYDFFMKKRDSSENRNRGYEPVENFDRIVSGEYEPPVVLQVNGKYYVIGGRTRIYASIASNTPIKIKILKPNDL
jgi:hypothetical protein